MNGIITWLAAADRCGSDGGFIVASFELTADGQISPNADGRAAEQYTATGLIGLLVIGACNMAQSSCADGQPLG